jgi:hypothetical protein
MEAEMRDPIWATTEVMELGQLPDETPVFQNRLAHESDGVVVINRINTHTSFKSHVESSLCKMIGRDWQPGRDCQALPFWPEKIARAACTVGRVVMEKSPVLRGHGILENTLHYRD